MSYKILLLTKYGTLGGSSRYRFYQYLPYLRSQNLEVEVSPLLDNNYVENVNKNVVENINEKLTNIHNRRRISIGMLLSYFNRLQQLLRCRSYDLLWIEKELLPYIPAWLEIFLTKGVPYIVDYDDAQFHMYDHYSSKLVKLFLADKIDTIISNSILTIAGNQYIANRASKAGAKRIEIIPTVVDLNRYSLKRDVGRNEPFNIGWIGSPITTRYLKSMKPIFQELNQKYNCTFTMIGAGNLNFEGVKLNIKEWKESSEVENLKDFNVGIMPLDNNIWERGKCGIKLIQYMACGLPVVGTPIGVNREIIKHGINGFQATSANEWIEYLSMLAENRDLRYVMGENGRKMVESNYCLGITAPKLCQLLNSCI
jgi:glycosyltransferase involved in cell wall biosynthesis